MNIGKLYFAVFLLLFLAFDPAESGNTIKLLSDIYY